MNHERKKLNAKRLTAILSAFDALLSFQKVAPDDREKMFRRKISSLADVYTDFPEKNVVKIIEERGWTICPMMANDLMKLTFA